VAKTGIIQRRCDTRYDADSFRLIAKLIKTRPFVITLTNYWYSSSSAYCFDYRITTLFSGAFGTHKFLFSNDNHAASVCGPGPNLAVTGYSGIDGTNRVDDSDAVGFLVASRIKAVASVAK